MVLIRAWNVPSISTASTVAFSQVVLPDPVSTSTSMAPPSVGNSQVSGGGSAAFCLAGFGLGLAGASTSSALGVAANSVALASARTLRRGSIRRRRPRDHALCREPGRPKARDLAPRRSLPMRLRSRFLTLPRHAAPSRNFTPLKFIAKFVAPASSGAGWL